MEAFSHGIETYVFGATMKEIFESWNLEYESAWYMVPILLRLVDLYKYDLDHDLAPFLAGPYLENPRL